MEGERDNQTSLVSTGPRLAMTATWVLHAGRHRSKQIYAQEMKRGHIELSIDKVVMFGIAGSGKTCALTVMLGDNPPNVRSSTPLMKRPVEVLFMDVDKKLHWKIKTLQEVNDSIAEIIRSRMPKQAAEALVDITSPSSPSQQPSHTPADQPRPKVTTTMTSPAAKETPSPPKKKPTGTVQSEVEGSLDSSTDMDEEFISLINTSPPSSEPILRLRQILVLDSGGQPHFHELIPVFLNGASDFVYVFKVHESLDIRSMIHYFKEGKLVFQFRASQTKHVHYIPSSESLRYVISLAILHQGTTTCVY